MTIPINFVSSPNIEEVFLDDFGNPLTGELRSFSDINRATPKSIYVISGSPPNYTVTPLPNPAPIAAGKLQDGSGNSVSPIYNIVDENGNPELYFLQTYDNGVAAVIETREGWPYGADGGGSSELLHAENFVPNGQFKFHNEINEDPVSGRAEGEIIDSETYVAPGGWTFNRPSISTASDFVKFFRYPQYVSTPTGSPRFAIDVSCTSADGTNLFKDLRINWEDVNKFASPDQDYTFWFNAQSLDASERDVDLVLIRYFGTGGTPSATEEVILDTLTINSSMQSFQVQFQPGVPAGVNVGTNNDDLFSLVIRFPVDTAFNIRLTDFAFIEGNVEILEFPVNTDRDFFTRSIFDPATRKNDGTTLYLPVISTLKGLVYDDSNIGKVEPYFVTENPPSAVDENTNLLLCDGASYQYEAYSPLGIPYSRLGQKLFITDLGANIFGNGPDFVDVGIPDPGVDSVFFISPNQAGVAANASDGAIATGFTFTDVCVGVAGGYGGYNSYYGALFDGTVLPAVQIISGSQIFGAVLPVEDLQGPDATNFGFLNQATVGFPTFTVVPTTGAVPLEGTGFLFYSLGSTFQPWYTVNGAGIDPGFGTVPIQINLDSTWNTDQVGLATYAAIRGSTQTGIQALAGAAVPDGSYWLFSTVTNGDWYVWYKVNGVGTDPLVANRTGILVEILSTDTDAQVCFKTATALNSIYFSVPDMRGVFLKGYGDKFSSNDLLFTNSAINPTLITGNYQAQAFASHTHGLHEALFAGSEAAVGTGLVNLNLSTEPAGGSGTRPLNLEVYYKIRY